MTRLLALKSTLLACLVSAMMLICAASASASFGFVNGLNMFGGGAAGNLTQWDYPVGLTRAADGSVFVLDGNANRVVKLDADGNFLLEWGSAGSADGQLLGPSAIAISPVDGQVYVSDGNNHRIQVFDQSGGFLRKWGASGSADGSFAYPQGIAFDSAGKVFVSDSNNHRVQYFDSDGNFLGKIADASGPGQLAFPKGIAIGSDGRIYVVDRGYLAPTSHGRVAVYASISDPDPHHYLGSIGSYGDNPGQFIDPMGVTVRAGSPYDEIYVTNVWNAHRIQRFTTDLSAPTPLLSRWGYDNGYGDGGVTNGGPGYGSEPGKFTGPTQIILDASNNAWVTDGGNQRIQIFSDADAPGGATFVRLFGTDGSSPGQFRHPVSVAAAPDRTAYVAEYDGATYSRIQHVTARGAVLDTFAPSGSGDGQILDAYGMSVGPGGDLWVADSGNNRVQRFDATGGFKSQITAVAGTGLSSPSDVVVASDGKVYIADFGNRRIATIDADGSTQGQWGTMGTTDDAAEFQGLAGIALSPDEQHVYVLDGWGNHVKKFSTTGTFEAKSAPYSPSGGTGNGEFKNPYGIDVDPTSGDVLVTDQSNDRFQRLSSSLVFISKTGSHGRDLGEFQSPMGISVDPNGYVWVPDSVNDRVQRFGDVPGVTITSPVAGTALTGTTAQVSYTVTDAAADCDIADGATVGPLAPGAQTITVTCSNGRGSGSASVNVNVPAPVVPPGTSSPAAGAVTLKLPKKLKLSKSRKLKFSVTCPDGCAVSSQLLFGKKGSRLKQVRKAPGPGPQTVTVTLSSAQGAKAKAWMVNNKSVYLSVVVQSYKAIQGKTGKAKVAK
ncbi:MAG: SMP-30/gluconolactonase/LRE family protein [Thermoleophilaceae bacterium]|nr:SMP-30/gluconolactonase/LRE family protein [Thermoleophilaceae bacterium]